MKPQYPATLRLIIALIAAALGLASPGVAGAASMDIPTYTGLYGRYLFPGATINHAGGSCSLGMLMTAKDRFGKKHLYGVSAGHCAVSAYGKTGDEQPLVYWRPDNKTAIAAGRYTAAVDTYHRGPNKPGADGGGITALADYKGLIRQPGDEVDLGIISFNDQMLDYIDPYIGSKYLITGTADPANLERGDTICKLGYKTNETCGPYIGGDATTGTADYAAGQGDSGGIVYIPTSENTAQVVGIHSTTHTASTGQVTSRFTWKAGESAASKTVIGNRGACVGQDTCPLVARVPGVCAAVMGVHIGTKLRRWGVIGVDNQRG